MFEKEINLFSLVVNVLVMKVTVGKYTTDAHDLDSLMTFISCLFGLEFVDLWSMKMSSNMVIFINEKSSKKLTVDDEAGEVRDLIEIFNRFQGGRIVSMSVLFSYYFQAKKEFVFSAFLTEEPKVKLTHFTLACYNLSLVTLLMSSPSFFFVVKKHRVINSHIYFEGSAGIRVFRFVTIYDSLPANWIRLSDNALIAEEIANDILAANAVMGLPHLLVEINRAYSRSYVENSLFL